MVKRPQRGINRTGKVDILTIKESRIQKTRKTPRAMIWPMSPPGMFAVLG